MNAPSTITLNNGVEMPALGLGVFQTPPDETRDAVRSALGSGYRLIDTAAAYGNERQVGDAVYTSGVNRSEVFLETKIWISDYGYDETLHGFEKSARKLGVEQIDLLILHQALPSAFDQTLEASRALETLPEGQLFLPMLVRDTRSMKLLYQWCGDETHLVSVVSRSHRVVALADTRHRNAVIAELSFRL